MATARDGTNPYGDGLGVGGKFKKRPHRRSTQSTPYDRPPIAARNPNSNGWLSKLVDPAQKLIASGAHKLFASVFRKRLPAPSPSPPFIERTDEEWRENHQEESLTELPGSGEGVINQLDKPGSNADGGEFNELEEILKKKTFTRSEIDRLTTLLHSRSADKPNAIEEKQQPERRNLSQQRNEVHQNTIFKESGTDQFISTPLVSRAVIDEDVGSPAELARAYMGSRPSKVSPSIQNFGTQALVVDSRVPENEIVASKSPNMPLVARHSGHAGGIRNTFVTPRSRGRSAIYNMARTPYSRIHSVARLKDEGLTSYGAPSSSSLNQNVLEQGRLSASRQEALKRTSSVLENDIGSVGPIRRIRQKSNLLSPKILSLPPPRSARRNHEPNSMLDIQHFSSHVQRSTLSKDTKQKFAQTIAENEIVDTTGPSFTAVPSKSRETASQILQCLDMLVSTRDKSPAKMSTSMLSGQALRSLENVESPKYAHSPLDKNKVDESGSLALDVNATASSRMATFNGNGTTKLFASIQEPVPAVKSMNSGKSDEDNIPGAQVSGSCALKIANDLPQARKQGFRISAHEDLLDADDDDRCNGVVFPLENDIRESPDNECKNAASKSITIERSSATEVKKFVNSDLKPDPGTPNGLVPVEKAAGAIFMPTLSTNSVPAVDKAFSKESYAATFTAVAKPVPKETNATVQASTSSFCDMGKSSSELKFTSFTSQSDKPICATSVATSNIGSPKPPESNKALKNDTVNAEEFTLPQTAAASPASATSSGGTIFSSATGNNSSPMSGSLGPNPFSFNASAVPSVSSGFTSQGSSGSSTSLHSATTSVFSVPATQCAINGSSSPTHASAPSPTSAPVFEFASSSNPSTASSNQATKCVQTEVGVMDSGINNLFSAPGSSPAFPSQGNMFDSSVSSVANFAARSSSNSTSAAIVGSGSSMFSSTSSAFLKNVGSNVGMSSASSSVGSTSSNGLSGSGITAASTVISGTSTAGSPANSIFGFSASAASSAMTSSSPLTTSTTVSATSKQGMPFQFSSSASSPSFSLTGNTSSSGNSLFSSAAPAGNLFNSGSSFVSSSGQSGSNTGSFPGWEASKSTFGSSFSSSSSSAGFTFAANSASVSVANSAPSVFGSTTGTSASSLFSFTTAAAAPSPAPIQTFGGNSTSFTFGSSPSNNSDQMEDSMAEDTVQASAPVPAAPLFGQQTASPATSFFGQPSQSSNTVASMFGQQPMQAATPAPMFAQQPSSSGFTFSGAPTNPNPFPFGNQQNTGIAQSSFPFQASGSLGSGSGFSIGSGGDDKSSRRIVKVNRNKTRKK